MALAFGCNFVLLGSYYILRPIRDTMATVFGVAHLPALFAGTLLLTMICSPAFSWFTDTFKLSRVLPGVFLFLALNILGFCGWFRVSPESRYLAAAFYWWFSVVNLFMISVFWALMVDIFTPSQATRLLPSIAASGSLGAIAGPIITSLFVHRFGMSGLLLTAASGFLIVVMLVRAMIREKARLHAEHVETQRSTFDHKLKGSAFDGFRALFASPYLLNQAAFMILMTWIATIGYFLQTELVTQAFADLQRRTQALAEIDLIVNICSAAFALFGLSRLTIRFGITRSLVLNPVLMVLSFVLMALSPTLIMLQSMQTLRRVTQYAIARPCREICFTVVDQNSRYKAKNIIDVIMYRLGDFTAAGAQAGLRALGVGVGGSLSLGILVSCAWGVVAWTMRRQYEDHQKILNAREHNGVR